jgi:hypothetical protein
MLKVWGLEAPAVTRTAVRTELAEARGGVHPRLLEASKRQNRRLGVSDSPTRAPAWVTSDHAREHTAHHHRCACGLSNRFFNIPSEHFELSTGSSLGHSAISLLAYTVT